MTCTLPAPTSIGLSVTGSLTFYYNDKRVKFEISLCFVLCKIIYHFLFDTMCQHSAQNTGKFSRLFILCTKLKRSQFQNNNRLSWKIKLYRFFFIFVFTFYIGIYSSSIICFKNSIREMLVFDAVCGYLNLLSLKLAALENLQTHDFPAVK